MSIKEKLILKAFMKFSDSDIIHAYNTMKGHDSEFSEYEKLTFEMIKETLKIRNIEIK